MGQNFDQAKRDNTFWTMPNILHPSVHLSTLLFIIIIQLFAATKDTNDRVTHTLHANIAFLNFAERPKLLNSYFNNVVIDQGSIPNYSYNFLFTVYWKPISSPTIVSEREKMSIKEYLIRVYLSFLGP